MQDYGRVDTRPSGHMTFEELARQMYELMSNNGVSSQDEARVSERKRDDKAATKK
jgi:hypothetical protein